MKLNRNWSMGCLFAVLLVLAISTIAFADTVVTETTTHYPYFRWGGGPVGGLFYFLGDLVALPFRLLGDLFAGLF